jgi:hypothetical protein
MAEQNKTKQILQLRKALLDCLLSLYLRFFPVNSCFCILICIYYFILSMFLLLLLFFFSVNNAATTVKRLPAAAMHQHYMLVQLEQGS